MPETLVGVLARDRPEGLQACLQGLARAGSPARVLIHLDAAEPEVAEIAAASGHDVMVSESHIGIGASLNRVLATREPGQHFCRVDSDTELVTEGWLAMLVADLAKWAMVGTVLQEWNGTWARKVPPEPESGTIKLRLGRGMGSVMCCGAAACETLGAFREGVPYSLEDTDWVDRLHKARLQAGMNLAVVAREAVKPSRKLWRGTSEPAPEFIAARRAFYDETRPIHRPLPVMA